MYAGEALGPCYFSPCKLTIVRYHILLVVLTALLTERTYWISLLELPTETPQLKLPTEITYRNCPLKMPKGIISWIYLPTLLTWHLIAFL